MRIEDKEDYIIYMKIVFIKCAFSLFLGSDYVERKQGTSLRRNRKNKQWNKLVYSLDRRRKTFLKMKLNQEIIRSLPVLRSLIFDIFLSGLIITT